MEANPEKQSKGMESDNWFGGKVKDDPFEEVIFGQLWN